MITLLTIPKPFKGEFNLIQRNAIQSWINLGKKVEVILFGDEEGVKELAEELNVTCFPEVIKNEFGTPLVSDVFEKAQNLSKNELLCYVNADIILMNDFLRTIKEVLSQKKRFLMVGQRWDVDIKEPIDFRPGWEEELRTLVAKKGRLHPQTGMDYFIFKKGAYKKIPSFAIGRTSWDNWLIYKARVIGMPVIDATNRVTAIHQNHDYSYGFKKNEDVWSSPEAKLNLDLAGGMDHIFTLKDVTHRITEKGVKPALNREDIRRSITTIPILYPWTKILIKMLMSVHGFLKWIGLVKGRDLK